MTNIMTKYDDKMTTKISNKNNRITKKFKIKRNFIKRERIFIILSLFPLYTKKFFVYYIYIKYIKEKNLLFYKYKI